MRRRARQGRALLTALIVTSLLLVFAAAVTDNALLRLHLTNRRADSLKALEAANAGLSAACAELARDPDFTGALEETLAGGGRYRLSFDGLSTNNIARFEGVPGWRGRVVPPHTAHLVAEGWGPHGTQRIVEAVVRLQGSPYALAASKRIESAAATTVGGVEALDVPLGTLLAQSSYPLAGHVYAGESVALGASSLITGRVDSGGSINLGLGGVALEGTESPVDVSLPDLVIADFDNQTVPGVTVVAAGDYGPASPLQTGPALPGTHYLSGPVYVDGDIRLTGPLTLDNCYLFVNGDLVVDGTLQGTGSLFVTGRTELLAGVLLDPSHRIAIFSQGDIDMPLGGVFQGVLYSHGDITLLLGAQVVGAVIAQAGETSPGGNLTLGASSKVLHFPEYTAFAAQWFARGEGAGIERLTWNDVWGESP